MKEYLIQGIQETISGLKEISALLADIRRQDGLLSDSDLERMRSQAYEAAELKAMSLAGPLAAPSEVAAAPVAVPLLANLIAAQAEQAGRHRPAHERNLAYVRGMAVRAFDAKAVAPVTAFQYRLPIGKLGLQLGPPRRQITVPMAVEVFVKLRGRHDQLLPQELFLIVKDYSRMALIHIFLRHRIRDRLAVITVMRIDVLTVQDNPPTFLTVMHSHYSPLLLLFFQVHSTTE